MIIKKNIYNQYKVDNKKSANTAKIVLPKLKQDSFEVNSLNKKRKLVSFSATRLNLESTNPLIPNFESLKKIFMAANKISNDDSKELKADIKARLIGDNQGINDAATLNSSNAAIVSGEIGNIFDSQTRSEIVNALKAPNKGINDNLEVVRSQSAKALGEIGKNADQQLQTLIVNQLINIDGRGVNDNDTEVVKNSIRALGIIGKVANPTIKNEIVTKLKNGIMHGNENVARAYISALGEAASTADQTTQNNVINALIDNSIRDSDVNKRKDAVWSLTDIGKSARTNDQKDIILTALIEDGQGIKDVSPEVRNYSLAALGQIPLSNEQPDTIFYQLTSNGHGIKDNDFQVRASAVIALNKIVSEGNDDLKKIFIDQLIDQLLDYSQDVNDQYYQVFQTKSIDALSKIGSVKNEDFQTKIVKALIAPQKGIKHNHFLIRKHSATALGKVGVTASPAIQDEIVKQLTTPNQGIYDNHIRVKQESTKSLLAIAGKTNRPELRNNIENQLMQTNLGLNDGEERARAQYANLWGKIACSTQNPNLQTYTINRLVAQNQGINDNDPSVKRESIRALGKIGSTHAIQSKEIIDILTAQNQGINDNDPSVKNASIRALGEIGSAHATQSEKIIDILTAQNQGIKDDDLQVKEASIKALGVIKVDAAQALRVFNILTADECINNNNLEIRKASAEALGQIGSTDPAQALPVLNALIAPNRGIGINDNVDVQKASIDAITNIARKKGNLDANQNDVNPDKSRMTIVTKVLKTLKQLEATTQSPIIYTKSIINRKDLEEKDSFLQSLKMFALAPLKTMQARTRELIDPREFPFDRVHDLTLSQRSSLKKEIDHLVEKEKLNEDCFFIPNDQQQRRAQVLPKELAEKVYQNAFKKE